MRQPRGSNKRGATDQASGVAKKSRASSRQVPEQAARGTRRSKEELLAESEEPERLLRQRRREQQQKERPKSGRQPRRGREQQEKGKEQQAGRGEPAQHPAAGMERRQRPGSAGGPPAQQQVTNWGCAGGIGMCWVCVRAVWPTSCAA